MKTQMRSSQALRGLVLSLLVMVWLGGAARAQLEIGRLTASTAQPGMRFGESMASHGDVLFVGEVPTSNAARRPGRVHAYRHDGLVWRLEQTIEASDATWGDRFGRTLAFDGRTLLVASGQESVYFFEHDGSRWIERRVVTPPRFRTNGSFGLSLDVDGRWAVVGAPLDSTDVDSGGGVYVYHRGTGNWDLIRRVAAPDQEASDAAGYCALRGDEILIGAPGVDGGGEVGVWQRTAGAWSRAQRLSPDVQGDFRFGIGIELDGSVAVVKADGGAGAVYVLEWSSAGWRKTQRLAPADSTFSGRFGVSLGVEGDRILIGTSNPSLPQAVPFPLAILFERTPAGWRESSELLPLPTQRPRPATSVALAGERVLVGDAYDPLDFTVSEAGSVSELLLPGAAPQAFNGSNVNRDRLSADVAVAGQDWTATVHVTSGTCSGLAFLWVQERTRPGRLLHGRAELLIDGPELALIGPVLHQGRGTSAMFRTNIPALTSLVGRTWAAQSVLLGCGSLAFTNGVAGVVQ